MDESVFWEYGYESINAPRVQFLIPAKCMELSSAKIDPFTKKHQ